MHNGKGPRIRQNRAGRWLVDLRGLGGGRLDLGLCDAGRALELAIAAGLRAAGREQLTFERFSLARCWERYQAGDTYAALADGGKRAADCHAVALLKVLGPDLDVNGADWPMVWTRALAHWAGRTAPTTVNKRRSLLLRILRFCHAPAKNGGQRGPVRAVPDVEGYRRARGMPRDRWLRRPEFRALVLALSPRRALWLALGCWTGQRYSDVCRMTWADVNLHDNTWRRYHTKTHGRRHFDVLPLVPELAAFLRSAVAVDAPPHPEEPQSIGMGPGTRRPQSVGASTPIVGAWRNARRDLGIRCDALGIARMCLHDCRRTCATWLLEAGVNEVTARWWLGLAAESAMLNRIYGRRGPQQARRADTDIVTCVAEYTRDLPMIGGVP